MEFKNPDVEQYKRCIKIMEIVKGSKYKATLACNEIESQYTQCIDHIEREDEKKRKEVFHTCLKSSKTDEELENCEKTMKWPSTLRIDRHKCGESRYDSYRGIRI